MTFMRDVKHVEMWIDLGAFGVGRMVFGRPPTGPALSARGCQPTIKLS
jgi:hypothetical protein